MGNHRKLRQNVLMGNGDTYTLGVAIVRARSQDGTPRYLELIPMDEKIDLTNADNRDLVTLYMEKSVVRNRELRQPEEPTPELPPLEEPS